MLLTFFRNLFPKNSGMILPQTGIFWNNIPERFIIPEQHSGNLQLTEKIVPEIVPESRIFRTFSIMEMEEISGSFPFVNCNPEFRWKPYSVLISLFNALIDIHTWYLVDIFYVVHTNLNVLSDIKIKTHTFIDSVDTQFMIIHTATSILYFWFGLVFVVYLR